MLIVWKGVKAGHIIALPGCVYFFPLKELVPQEWGTERMIGTVTKQEGNYGRKVRAEAAPCTGAAHKWRSIQSRALKTAVWSSSDVCLPCSDIMTEPENRCRCSAGTSVTSEWRDLERVPLSFLPLWAPISKMGLVVPLQDPHRVVRKIS